MTKTIRIGFIGLGGIATRAHIPALASIPGVVIQAGAEINTAQAERTQQRFGIPNVYASYEEMLEKESLDAAFVCLPNFLHKDAGLAALGKGLHVYCEKPMGLSSAEAKALVDAANAQNLILMPGFNLRYFPNFVRAHELMLQKRLGRILHVQLVAAKPGPYMGWDPKSEWYFDPRNVGVLYDQGSHILDLLFYIGRLDIKEISATSCAALEALPDTSNIAVHFRNGSSVVGSMGLTWGAPANLTMLQFHGTAGSMIVTDGYFEHRTPKNGGIDRLGTLLGNAQEIVSKGVRKVISGKSDESPYLLAARNFVEAIRGESTLRTSPADAVSVHRTLEAIRRSLEAGPSGAWQMTREQGTRS